jgi:RsbT co-antagonist protein rsbRD N-terminal domain
MANTKILTKLGDYLLNNREEIVKEWLVAVQHNPDIASSNRIDDAELIDHLPQLLENIAERLNDPQSHYDYVAITHPGRSHGKFRWRQGYKLQEVIREAGVMHWILMRDCLNAFEREAGPLENETRETAERIMHGAVEDLLADSAGQYLQEQENRLTHLNARLADAVAELRQQKRGGDTPSKSDKTRG